MHNKFHDFLRFFVVSFVLNIMIILVLNSLINFLVYLNACLYKKKRFLNCLFSCFTNSAELQLFSEMTL